MRGIRVPGYLNLMRPQACLRPILVCYRNRCHPISAFSGPCDIPTLAEVVRAFARLSFIGHTYVAVRLLTVRTAVEAGFVVVGNVEEVLEFHQALFFFYEKSGQLFEKVTKRRAQ